jgi:hypothetical protein
MPRRIDPDKKKRRYRFNGIWGMKGGLIELRKELATLHRKLDDQDDIDDPIWVKHWIDAFEAEIAKKERRRELKAREKRIHHKPAAEYPRPLTE